MTLTRHWSANSSMASWLSLRVLRQTLNEHCDINNNNYNNNNSNTASAAPITSGIVTNTELAPECVEEGHFRPHCIHRTHRHNRESCKNGLTDRDVVWEAES